MKLYVSGLPSGTSERDVRSLFGQFADVVKVEAPAGRQAGNVTWERGFVHVELAGVDPATLQKCIKAYNGSVWKGSKLIVARAHPDFRERILAERQADEAQEAQEQECCRTDAAPLKIKLPASKSAQGVRTILPVDPVIGTGCKRRFFPPTPDLPLSEILAVDNLPKHRSRLYRANREWDATLQSRLQQPPPDPAIFSLFTGRSHDGPGHDGVKKSQVARPGGLAPPANRAGKPYAYEDAAELAVVDFGVDDVQPRGAAVNSGYDSDDDVGAEDAIFGARAAAEPRSSVARGAHAPLPRVGSAVRDGGQRGTKAAKSAADVYGEENDDDYVPLELLDDGMDALDVLLGDTAGDSADDDRLDAAPRRGPPLVAGDSIGLGGRSVQSFSNHSQRPNGEGDATARICEATAADGAASTPRRVDERSAAPSDAAAEVSGAEDDSSDGSIEGTVHSDELYREPTLASHLSEDEGGGDDFTEALSGRSSDDDSADIAMDGGDGGAQEDLTGAWQRVMALAAGHSPRSNTAALSLDLADDDGGDAAGAPDSDDGIDALAVGGSDSEGSGDSKGGGEERDSVPLTTSADLDDAVGAVVQVPTAQQPVSVGRSAKRLREDDAGPETARASVRRGEGAQQRGAVARRREGRGADEEASLGDAWSRVLALAAGADGDQEPATGEEDDIDHEDGLGEEQVDGSAGAARSKQQPNRRQQEAPDAEPVDADFEALQAEIAAQMAAAKRAKPRKRRSKPMPSSTEDADPGSNAPKPDDGKALDGPAPSGACTDSRSLCPPVAERAANTLSSLFQNDQPPAAAAAPGGGLLGSDDQQRDPRVAALFAVQPFQSAPKERAPGGEEAAPAAALSAEAAGDSSAGATGRGVRLESATELARRFRGVWGGAQAQAEQRKRAEEFVRREDLALLEAQLKAGRPELMADFRKKQKTVLKKSKAAKKAARVRV